MNKVNLLFLALLYINVSNAQNVGIGTNTPAASAILETSSTTQGFLPPRLTISQRDAITNPATGLIIFCIDCDELDVFNGVIWKSMSGTAACVSSSPPFVKICDQIWMSNNLDVSKYRNGDVIPQVTDPAVWASLTIGAWCWYNNDSATYAAIYGKLYNSYAVNDSRGLAPLGWHIPSFTEWRTLEPCLGGVSIAGGKMKESGTAHWSIPNTNATNSSGFKALPGGFRSPNGQFNVLGFNGYYWSSTNFLSNLVWFRYFSYNDEIYNESYDYMSYGLSVRCLKD